MPDTREFAAGYEYFSIEVICRLASGKSRNRTSKKFFGGAFGDPEKALSALSFQFFWNSALSSSLEPFLTKKYVVSESSETTYLRGFRVVGVTGLECVPRVLVMQDDLL